MSARTLDGTSLATRIKEEVATAVADLADRTGIRPGLATVLVGDDPASATYVRMKGRACRKVGIRNIAHHLPSTTTQDELDRLVAKLSADPAVHGILVQLPLPDGLDPRPILDGVDPAKDVDGFHPDNVGRLALRDREPDFLPCTPAGILCLLQESGVPLAGARACVLGRSNVVGLPTALLLIHASATVTVCHTRTRNVESLLREAEILVVAAGRPHVVGADSIRPGATVIDVGVNRIPDPSSPGKTILVGDVDTEAAREVAGAITPVPGGVGPMTIAMLMRNTWIAASRQAGERPDHTLRTST